jgi:predicted nucleic acid-binding protein
VIVVSDTSPLNYLILIQAIEILPQLFGKVHAPPRVIAELCHAGAADDVRQWAASPPAWLVVSTPSNSVPAASRLDQGEADAIALALELHADTVLIDERKGRRIAEEQGLVAVGTLTVLEFAAERKLLELPETLDALRQTTFYITEEFIEAALARDAERKRQGS